MEEADSAGRPRIAHSPGRTGHWHRLDAHLAGTGELAGAFAEDFGGGRRWHSGSDVVMTSARAHVPGRMLWREWWPRGAPLAFPTSSTLRGWSASWEGIAATYRRSSQGGALLGHHSGMPDFASGIAGRLSTGSVLADSSLDREFDGIVADLRKSGFGDLRVEVAAVSLPDWLPLDASRDEADQLRRLDVFTRTVFSALVDAEYLDT